ncbi:HTH domain-containing protein [Ruminococcaceae bacterium FB2012]|nr:HTH domain-containing protein [Ruminococcaceae bacterium FB2012]
MRLKDKIYTENANLTHGHGTLDPAIFQPFPKNLPISKVFREIGLADELGSGMRNTYKYTRMYSGGEPSFVEDSIFRITVPLAEIATKKVGPDSELDPSNAPNRHDVGLNVGLADRILKMIGDNDQITMSALSESLNVTQRTIEREIKRLKENGKLQRTGGKRYGHWKIIG